MNDATAMAKQVESNPKQREINGRIFLYKRLTSVQKAGEEEKERIKEKRAGPRKQKRKENSIFLPNTKK
jgi:hypothetical protein